MAPVVEHALCITASGLIAAQLWLYPMEFHLERGIKIFWLDFCFYLIQISASQSSDLKAFASWQDLSRPHSNSAPQLSALNQLKFAPFKLTQPIQLRVELTSCVSFKLSANDPITTGNVSLTRLDMLDIDLASFFQLSGLMVRNARQVCSPCDTQLEQPVVIAPLRRLPCKSELKTKAINHILDTQSLSKSSCLMIWSQARARNKSKKWKGTYIPLRLQAMRFVIPCNCTVVCL